MGKWPGSRTVKRHRTMQQGQIRAAAREGAEKSMSIHSARGVLRA